MKIRNYLYIIHMALLILTTGSSIHGQYLDLLWERFAHYPFSGDARDISGFDNHGLVNGALLSEDHMGEGGSAYYFDGLDDYINCGSNLEFLSSTVTVSCWIKTEADMENSHIVSKYDFSSDAGFILGTQEGLAKWAGRNGTGQFIRITSGTKIDDNKWHSLIGVVDGDTWTLYVDGVRENQVESGSESVGLSTTVPLTIGNNFLGDDGDHRYFEGSVDDVIIYGRAMNECELHILSTGEPYEAR
jgi:hypothetical protein